MADEVFRPRRPDEEVNEINEIQEDVPVSPVPKETSGPPTKFQGQMPAAMRRAIESDKQEIKEFTNKGFNRMAEEQNAAGINPAVKFKEAQMPTTGGSDKLREMMGQLQGQYEEIQLPSMGKFYDGQNGPLNGIISIRPMTGEEEQILATPRFVRRGQAINMIFSRCMRETYRPENFLSIDRTFMLIFLRQISYTSAYNVEIKCANCEKRFETTIDLRALPVEYCPDNYGPILEDILPTTQWPFRYRLSSGKDEQDIIDHRDQRIKIAGDAAVDDTLTYRTSLLLDEINGVTSKGELQILIRNLPINDVAHMRNCLNEPPFGVNTQLEIPCPSCLEEFQIGLPLDANFFFPRRKKELTQA